MRYILKQKPAHGMSLPVSLMMIWRWGMSHIIKLSDELESFRCDRPDEWKMDEFISRAKELEDKIAALSVSVAAFGTLIHEAINGESAEPIATDGQITGYAISYEWLEKAGGTLSFADKYAEVALKYSDVDVKPSEVK